MIFSPSIKISMENAENKLIVKVKVKVTVKVKVKIV